MTFIDLLSNEATMLFVGLAFGAVAGSFLNVCAHRIPLGQSVVTPVPDVPNAILPFLGSEIFLCSLG